MPTFLTRGTARKPAPNFQSVTAIPPPVGGLNARDPLASMPATDAYVMENWVPQHYGLKMRKGYAEWRLPNDGQSVKSIFNYFPNTTTVSSSATFTTRPTTMPGKMFAATDTAIYDVTVSSLVAPTNVRALSGTAEAGRFTAVNFANSAGTWLMLASEADGYFTYDGATWVKVTLGVGATQVSNVDPVTFVHVALWKRRPWFIQKNTSKVWYLAVDSLYGAATALDVGPILKRGGALAWVATWTIDAGEGIDDLLVICSENGEVLIYKGTDPASSTTFSLVGRWEVGAVPKGRRGYCQIGGDLLILSTIGISPVSFITRGGANLLAASEKNYTSKISSQFSSDLAGSYNQFGWGLSIVSSEGNLLVTTPLTGNVQYSMNIQNSSWTKFTGMPMVCATEVAGWTFFGTATSKVMLAFIGNTDNQQLSGAPDSPIVGLLNPAFNGMGQPAQAKHFLLAKVGFLTNLSLSVSMTMNVDFVTSRPASTAFIPSPALSVWDTALWDAGLWDGAMSPRVLWQNTPGVGYFGSLALLTSSNGDLTLTDITFVYEKGGVL